MQIMSGQKQKGFGYGGFAIKPKGIGLETQLAQMGYGLPSMSGRSHSSVLNIGKKRVLNEDESVLLLLIIIIIIKSQFYCVSYMMNFDVCFNMTLFEISNLI